jgi:transposase
MHRRKFSDKFKTGTVKLVSKRGMPMAQAARDLGVYKSVLGRWIKAFAADPQHAFPGHRQIRPE